MPTYRNDSSTTAYLVKNTAGQQVSVEPGDTIQTYQILDSIPDMTEISETPYWNPAKGTHDITSSGDDVEVTLDSATDEVEIWNDSSAEITIYLNSKSNTPGLRVPIGTSRIIKQLRDRVSKLILAVSAAISSGECTVTEINYDS